MFLDMVSTWTRTSWHKNEDINLTEVLQPGTDTD